jgi:hypothetical protein
VSTFTVLGQFLAQILQHKMQLQELLLECLEVRLFLLEADGSGYLLNDPKLMHLLDAADYFVNLVLSVVIMDLHGFLELLEFSSHT